MRISMLLPITVSLLFASTLRSEDADPIKVRFNKAKASFERAIERARQVVLEDMDKREDAARKKPDLKAVNEIKLQREAFEESDDIQKFFTPEINRTLAPERKSFAEAYEQAIKDYLRVKKDSEANQLQAEYEFLKVDLTPVAAPPKPIFSKPARLLEAGMVFEGTGQGHWPAKTRTITQVLTIESIEGNNVTGHIVGTPDGQNTKIYGLTNSSRDTLVWNPSASRSDRCIFSSDGSVTYTWSDNVSHHFGNFNLNRTTAGPAIANGTSTAPPIDPAYATVPESKKPLDAAPVKTLVGQLYASKGGTFLDNNEIYMYVDGTEGSIKKWLFDASKGRRTVRLFPADTQFAFALRDGADKRVRAKVTGRYDGPTRMWINSIVEVDRKPEIGLGRP